jgi:hypothetical protein
MSKNDAKIFCEYIRGLFIEPLSSDDLEQVEEFYYSGWSTSKVVEYFEDSMNAGYHLR